MKHRNFERSVPSIAFMTAALLALVGAPGCDKKDASADPAPSAVDELASAPASSQELRLAALSPDVPDTKLSGLPTPEDLEEEAAKTLAPENLEAELDRLEAEITGD
jgi:hypothetical protein